MKINKYLCAKTILVMSLITIAPTALAQASFDQFNPAYSSGGVEYLHRLFGSIIDTIMGSESAGEKTLLGAFMSVFGVATYFLGLIFLMYNAVRGMVDSAEDGQFLGKKASSAWLPMRLAIGAAMMAPSKSGFSLIQVLVIWVALQGVGIADKAFQAVLVQFKDTQMIQNPHLPNTRPLIGNILRSQICAYAMNKTFTAVGSTNLVNAVMQTSSYKTLPIGLNIFEKEKQVTEIFWQRAGEERPTCGGISWDRNSIFDSNVKIVQQDILDGQNTAVIRLINGLKEVVDRHLFQGDVNIEQLKIEVGSLESDYNATLRALAITAMAKTNEGAMNDFIAKADDLGFLYAGMWLGHLNEWSNATQQALNAMPISRPVDFADRFDNTMLISVNDYMIIADEISRTLASKTEQIYKDGAGLPEATTAGEGANWINKLTLGLTSATLNQIGGGTMSHLTNLRDFGDNILVAGQVGLLAMATASGAAGSKAAEYTVGLGFSLKDFISTVAPFVTIALAALFALGLTLSVYLMMMPLIAWIIAVLNWLIAVVEAVIAAPLFAAAHMHPDGDERIGNAGEGYRLILNVVMRPSLMVVGILMGFLILDTIMGFVNEIFMPYLRGAQNGSIVGLVKYIGIVTAYVTLAMAIVTNCFSMVHLLPDRVMLYLGRSVAGLGNSEKIEGAMQSAVSSAGGKIHSAGVSAIKTNADKSAGDEQNVKAAQATKAPRSRDGDVL